MGSNRSRFYHFCMALLGCGLALSLFARCSPLVASIAKSQNPAGNSTSSKTPSSSSSNTSGDASGINSVALYGFPLKTSVTAKSVSGSTSLQSGDLKELRDRGQVELTLSIPDVNKVQAVFRVQGAPSDQQDFTGFHAYLKPVRTTAGPSGESGTYTFSVPPETDKDLRDTVLNHATEVILTNTTQ